jgi:hypothetical protein
LHAHQEGCTPDKYGQEGDQEAGSELGFLSEPAAVIFPRNEAVPTPPVGYRVMFLAFCLRGLSLPAHGFLRGLLFVYGVQLHHLTPNSILHIVCFITPCESFLGIDPHWVLWKFLFRLRPSVSLAENPELGEAVVSRRSESHYREFKMASSVQGWRQKWFYIKDQKSVESDQYGFAPFDASKGLMKLTTWDALPSEAEVENIKPLLAHIQGLKSAAGGGLTGTQLMAFFLQRRIQPLQSRVSKLWTYSGLADPSRVSAKDPEKKDLNKRVRSLTILTAKMEIPACKASFFDSTHPLPEVRALQPEILYVSVASLRYVLLIFCLLNPLQGHQFLTSRPPLPEEGPLNAEPSPAESEAPKVGDNQDGDEVKGSLERSDSMLCPPLAESETQVAERKWKHIEELTSSGTSNPKDAPESKLLLRAPTLISLGCLTCKCSHIFSLSSLGPYFFS